MAKSFSDLVDDEDFIKYAKRSIKSSSKDKDELLVSSIERILELIPSNQKRKAKRELRILIDAARASTIKPTKAIS